MLLNMVMFNEEEGVHFAYKRELAQIINNNESQENIILKDGFFIKRFPLKGLADIKKITKTSVVDGYNDLVDVSDNFKAKFYNSGAMINGEIFTIETEPKIAAKGLTLNDIVEKDGVDEKYLLMFIQKI